MSDYISPSDRALLVEAWNFGQFADDFDQSQAKPIRAALRRLCEALSQARPLPARLHCEACGERHVDRGAWATRSHKTHRCEHCGAEWRPFDFPTVGVEEHHNPDHMDRTGHKDSDYS